MGDSYIIYGMKQFRFILFCCALLVIPAKLAQAAELVMVDQAGCSWCERWDAEIGVIYGETPEGRIAPLRRVDIHEALPPDLAFIDGLVFTPTFVLIDKDREIGRINGYAGQDFFWGQLHQLLENLPSNTPEKRLDPDPLQRTDGAPDSIPTKG